MQGRSQLEGVRQPRPFTDLIDKPELRFHGVQSPYAWLPIILEPSLTFVISQTADSQISLSHVNSLRITSPSPFHFGHLTRPSRIIIRQHLTTACVPNTVPTLLTQVERVDYATDPLLRSASQLPGHVHCMGYSRASRSDARGWNDFPAVQQEMVRCALDS